PLPDFPAWVPTNAILPRSRRTEGSSGLRPCERRGRQERDRRRSVGAQALGWSSGGLCSVGEGRGGYSTAPGTAFAAPPAHVILGLDPGTQAWGLGDKTATTLPPPACRQTRRAERPSSS